MLARAGGLIPLVPHTKISRAAKSNSGHVCIDICDSARTCVSVRAGRSKLQ